MSELSEGESFRFICLRGRWGPVGRGVACDRLPPSVTTTTNPTNVQTNNAKEKGFVCQAANKFIISASRTDVRVRMKIALDSLGASMRCVHTKSFDNETFLGWRRVNTRLRVKTKLFCSHYKTWF